MLFRYLLILVSLFGGLTNTSAQEPWAVMTGQSVVEVRAGLRHIYSRLGRKDLVAALDSAAVTDLVSGNLKGLDLTRPLGCVVVPNQSGLGSAITFIPTSGEQAFLDFLRRHLLTVNIDANGKSSVTMPLVGTVHIRFDQNYAWFAFAAEDLNGPLPDLSKVIPEGHRKVQLAATIYLERLPADQRQVWLSRGQQGLQWLLKGSTQGSGQLAETLGLPMAGLLLKRLSEDAKEVTIYAHADRSSDQLWAKILVTPRPNIPWVTQVQQRAANPIRYEVPASLWATIRGKTDETAAKAAQTAFKKGESDRFTLTLKGGDQLELKAELSGAMLAYHSALDQGESKPSLKERIRERRRNKP
ncbi:MAG TPA: hypothetical protein PLN21_16845 [Gemmatales bacterium]|nr:hypothetical protein [Gemmatales bacterium]